MYAITCLHLWYQHMNKDVVVCFECSGARPSSDSWKGQHNEGVPHPTDDWKRVFGIYSWGYQSQMRKPGFTGLPTSDIPVQALVSGGSSVVNRRYLFQYVLITKPLKITNSRRNFCVEIIVKHTQVNDFNLAQPQRSHGGGFHCWRKPHIQTNAFTTKDWTLLN